MVNWHPQAMQGRAGADRWKVTAGAGPQEVMAAVDPQEATAAADPREATAGGEPPAKQVATGALLLPLVVKVGVAGNPPLEEEVGAAGNPPMAVEEGAAGSLPLAAKAVTAGSLPCRWRGSPNGRARTLHKCRTGGPLQPSIVPALLPSLGSPEGLDPLTTTSCAAVGAAGRGRQPINIRLSVMAVTRREETTFEAGVRVQIHSQFEPPFVHELGFGVAPGFQTFVSTQEQRDGNGIEPNWTNSYLHCDRNLTAKNRSGTMYCLT
ncbi:UNVERIFIED_CONTAM: hypothetical protein FKN15_053508 [Acipenser sinensis]